MMLEIDYNNPAHIEYIKMNPTYENCVEPNIEKFSFITLSDEKIKEIDTAIEKIITKKEKEAGHQIDKKSEHKRWRNGLQGEAVIEKFLGVDFMDLSVGESDDYNHADLLTLGINCGIKTVEYGNFPLVHTYVKRPEVIVIKINSNDFYVCGFAGQVPLTYYVEPTLILDPVLRAMGKKTGFWGIHRLKQFNNIEELKELVDND